MLSAPLGLQAGLNARLYDEWTPFPVTSLGDLQVREGLRAFKYATYLSGRGPQALVARNPLFTQHEIALHGPSLYWRAPGKGTVTFLAHVFASLNHDTFFTYVYDLRPPGRTAVNVAGNLVLCLAAAFVLSRFRSGRPRGVPDALPLFVGIATALTLAQNGLVRAETRFGLLVFASAGPLALLGLRAWWDVPRRRQVIIAIAIVATVTAAQLLSDWMLTQALSSVS